jgi:hypothetical protein
MLRSTLGVTVRRVPHPRRSCSKARHLGRCTDRGRAQPLQHARTPSPPRGVTAAATMATLAGTTMTSSAAAQRGGAGSGTLGEDQCTARPSAGRRSQLPNPGRKSSSPAGQRLRWWPRCLSRVPPDLGHNSSCLEEGKGSPPVELGEWRRTKLADPLPSRGEAGRGGLVALWSKKTRRRSGDEAGDGGGRSTGSRALRGLPRRRCVDFCQLS